MNKIKLGDYNTLEIVKSVDFGVYLDGGSEGEILLPRRYVPEGCQIGDEIEVFVYLDQDERPVATTEKPLAKVGDFACLKCVWVNEYGAFLNWGLMKDVFCPFHEQKRRMEIGNSYIVYLYVDEESYRIVASAKVEKFLAEDYPPYAPGDEVDLLIWQKTDLGFKVIIDNDYPGLIYENQIFRPVHTGDRMKGYIGTVRQDGKIDVLLQAAGRRQTLDFSEMLLNYLHENGGKCDLGDKSDAEEIKRRFQVSKKTYKKAVGDLYRRHLIVILGEEGIKLAE
ncbi:S1 RNA-binding domain-containing protein [Prevotella sp. KH2C16]|uniref:CvfB family protein n=1 Tax=Prevotella sp. KH2C16 TaxID=1855325 RepID=UPI0008EDA70E|nr:S1-like domain-containing RNA-binding protein [Prevotella sp. KH2C16]SFG45488.1 hypothetical protein SAMN05216383_1159 [Prevotella sp. KH2C16]